MKLKKLALKKSQHANETLHHEKRNDIITCFLKQKFKGGTCHPYSMSMYFAPDAKCQSVMASFRPDSKGALKNVCCLVICGPKRCSSNICKGIHMKLMKD